MLEAKTNRLFNTNFGIIIHDLIISILRLSLMFSFGLWKNVGNLVCVVREVCVLLGCFVTDFCILNAGLAITVINLRRIISGRYQA